MKVKPIFVMTVPAEDFEDNDIDKVRKVLHDTLKNDYHVLMILAEIEIPKIEVFYEKDFNKVKYEELKEIILKNLKQ